MKSILGTMMLLLAMCAGVISPGYGQTTIPFNGQQVFLSGTNIPWVNFAGDLGPGPIDTASFITVMDSVHAHGGNALRFWMHTDGTSTPQFGGDDKVTGPGVNAIADLQKILGLAWQRKIGLVLCLWSFDMQRATIDTNALRRNKLMLMDTSYTRAYITNSLIPMVNAVKGNPAVIGWEIFNEPEGMASEFGFGGVNKVPMASIQQFVNLAAGAIHRTDPSALVTNGAWSLIAETDVTLPAKPADLQTRLNSMTAAEKQEIEDNFYARYRYRTTASEILAPYAASDFNYYRDDRLKAAGGDSLGTLDFYCSHYYQDGRPVFLIPFTHQASVYGLTKPMVIAEFSPTATNGIPHPALYPTLHDLGYAGGTTWSWYGANPGFDQDTLKARTLVELSSMFSQYPDLVQIDPVSGTIYSFAAQPAILDSGETSLLSWKTAVGSAPTLNGGSVAIRDTARVTLGATTPYRLSTSGTNPESLTVTVQVYPSGRIISFTGLPGTIGVGDPVVLKWKAAHSSVVTLNGSGEPRSDSLTVHPDTTSKYTLLSHGSVNDSASVTIAVFPINQLNRALGKAVSTSGNSTNSALANPANAVDGDTTTAWGSSSSNNEWFDINLGQNFEIQRVTIIWGNNYATTYILSVSSDNSNWTDLRSITNGAGRTEVLDSLNHDGQYVLLSLGQRFLTTTGFLIKEIQVYGIARPLGVDNAASNLPDRFALYQNYPNPFNPSTTIRFALPVRSDVRIAVYNVLGQRVATLVQGSMDAGYHSLSWAPSVASGIYFCHMEATSEGTPGQRYQQTLKLMLLK